MNVKELIIALPIDSREKADVFYKALGLQYARDPKATEIPEPLEFRLTDATVLMLVPRDGFAFVTQGAPVATPGTSESVQSFIVDTTKTVDELTQKAKAAGAKIVAEPGRSYAGYSAQFRDLDGHLWMVVAIGA